YAASIFIFDPKTGRLHLRASSHADFIANEFSITPDQGLVGWAATTRQAVLSPNVSTDPRFLPTAALKETRSEVCVPLIAQQQVVGVLDLQSDRPDAFGSDDVYLLEALAGQLTLAIQEAESYDAERRQTERVNAMAEVARALVSILDIDDLLYEVVDLVTDHLGYERVHLFLRVGDQLVFRSGSGVHSGRWALEKVSYPIDGKGIIAWVAREGRPKISGNVQEEGAYVP